MRHGKAYDFERGIVTFIEPFVDGECHGVARQYDRDGKPMGTYRMVHGTGIDLWRCPHFDGSGEFYLAEVWPRRYGLLHGFEWWLDENQRSVYIERHYHDGLLHGIHREWKGRKLRRGYPKYFIRDKQVTKRQYLRACKSDATLPPFREQDNKPQRAFPPEIAKHLNPPKRKRKQ